MEGDTAGDCQAEAERGTAVTTNLLALLPEDVLADILRRLAPRGLAASRCVCKAWRDAIDARRLLRTELLPLSPGGIFINFHNYYISEFFSRPSTSRPSISSKHDYLPDAGTRSWSKVLDHCNGLLLVVAYDVLDRRLEYVLNPATRFCAPLPPCPPPLVEMNSSSEKYLVYDPTISPHYEVFSITSFWYNNNRLPEDPVVEQSEWPPSIYVIHVFSSRTGCWEQRSYVREGEAAGTIADMRHSPGDQRNAVYWRGALYVHCQSDFVMRISLANNKYQVIKPPKGIELQHFPQFHLGKSEKGVYCASIHGRCRIRVWILDQSPYKMEWVLKHNNNLIEWLLKNNLENVRHCPGRKVIGPWILDDVNYYYGKHMQDDDDAETTVQERLKWSLEASEGVKFACDTDNDDKVYYDSDDSIVGEKTGCSSSEGLLDEKLVWSFDCKDDILNGKWYSGYIEVLGFHPYKEIVFLSESITRGLAYHLKSSKVQIMGNLYPARYHQELGNEQLIRSSFLYTPSWLK
ncbi:hypothetical protein EJB05_56139, partial [Eragrostis curvula]